MNICLPKLTDYPNYNQSFNENNDVFRSGDPPGCILCSLLLGNWEKVHYFPSNVTRKKRCMHSLR